MSVFCQLELCPEKATLRGAIALLLYSRPPPQLKPDKITDFVLIVIICLCKRLFYFFVKNDWAMAVRKYYSKQPFQNHC